MDSASPGVDSQQLVGEQVVDDQLEDAAVEEAQHALQEDAQPQPEGQQGEVLGASAGGPGSGGSEHASEAAPAELPAGGGGATSAGEPPEDARLEHQGYPEPGEEGSQEQYAAPPDQPDQPDPSSKLNELEAFLRQPDAVMEPNIMDRLREYVMANGHPQQAVEYLTDSYVGYAQMASLVCAWLGLTEEEAGQGGAEPAGGHGPPPGKKQRLDEAFFLRQLAQERFDPQRFAGIFSSGGSGAPQWLNGLIAEPEGRQLIYELSAQYKNSLLLNFAIQKILMQPGREQEVAAVGSSLAGFFGVFHRLLAARLREAATANEKQLAALSEQLKESCCQSQHTYVHAQLLLRELAREAKGARFRRLSQELELHAAAAQGGVVWRMRQWLADPDMPPRDVVASALLCDMLSGAAAGGAPTSEVIKLHHMYSPHSQEPPPAIHLLRHPRVFEVLLRGLFHPGRQLGHDAHQAYTALLSLAASARDDRAEGGGLDLTAVPGTREALEMAVAVSHRALQDTKVSPEELARAGEALRYPVCAAGVLHIMGAQLTKAEYWQHSYHLLKSPPFLTLLYHVVAHQPLLHDKVLDLLARVLSALGNSNHDMAKGFLDVAVRLMQEAVAGRVFAVMNFAEAWRQQADPSLVRHFVFKVLEVAAPPYSAEFAGAMLRIMMSAGIRRQRMTSRDWAVKALLDEFAAACAQVQFQPPLTQREAQFLQDISSDRPPGYG